MTLALMGLVQDGYGKQAKLGLGLLAAGAFVYALFFVLKAKWTDDCAVARIYNGFNFILVTFAAIVFLLVICATVFDGEGRGQWKQPAIGLVVYGLGAFIQGSFFLNRKNPGR